MKIFWRPGLVGYAYDLDQKKDDHAKTLQQNENYVIQQVRDRFAGMEYVESWGELKNGCYFLIRIAAGEYP